MKKQQPHTIQGMQQDLSELHFPATHIFEGVNIRFTASDKTNTYSVTNEPGNTLIVSLKDIDSENKYENSNFKVLGTGAFNDKLIIFAKDLNAETNSDFIIKVFKDGEDWKATTLYVGNLKFQLSNPIQTLCYYENEDSQKVYWVDGFNTNRCINVAASKEVMNKWKDFSFDFTQRLEGSEVVTITKNPTGGYWGSGVVQYLCTYYNLYGGESAPFFVSSLYTLTLENKGLAAEAHSVNSFTFKFENLDTNYSYINIYSIVRTSINDTPVTKLAASLKYDELVSTELSYTDTNNYGETVAPTDLLYLGGNDFSANTITQKDNVLFLGNYTLKQHHLQSYKDYFEGQSIKFKYDSAFQIELDKAIGSPYMYTSNLDKSSFINRGFKARETYRFGIQFKHKSGKWSEALWIDDATPNKSPVNELGFRYIGYTVLNKDIINNLIADGFIQARPLVVLPSDTDREIVAQGVVSPTVYNVRNRISNSPFVQASWFYRPFSSEASPTSNLTDGTFLTCYHLRGIPTNTDYASEIQCLWKSPKTGYKVLKTENPYNDLLTKSSNTYNTYETECESSDDVMYRAILLYIKNATSYWDLRNKLREYSSQYDEIGDEGTVSNKYSSYFNVAVTNAGGDDSSSPHNFTDYENYIVKIYNAYSEYISADNLATSYDTNGMSKTMYSANCGEYFFIDNSIVTLNSPDIEFNDQIEASDLKFRIVGIAPIQGLMSDLVLETSTTQANIRDSTSLACGFYHVSLKHDINGDWETAGRIRCASPAWIDTVSNASDRSDTHPKYKEQFGWVVYPWQKEGSLTAQIKTDDDASEIHGTLKTKNLINTRYSLGNYYFKEDFINDYNYENSTCDIFNETSAKTILLKDLYATGESNLVYAGNYNSIITPSLTAYLDPYSKVPVSKVSTDSALSGWPLAISKEINNTMTYNNIYYGITEEGTADSYKTDSDKEWFTHPFSTLGVNLNYQSVAHAVINLNNGKANKMSTLPVMNSTIYEEETNFSSSLNKGNYTFGWVNGITNVSYVPRKFVSSKLINQNTLPSKFSYLYIGEVYRDKSKYKFGGTNENALLQNQWQVSGEAVLLTADTDLEIKWLEGDTYYQRYDAIKTVPENTENSNSVTEIFSFMCETRINLDARNDSLRGIEKLDYVTLANKTRVNPVYNQKNNFFTYQVLDSNLLQDEFKTSVTWSLTKEAGSTIDKWLGFNLASTLNLDGLYGEISNLMYYNDSLYALQPKAFSKLLYNESTALSSTEGSNVEIAKSGKMNGYKYITTKSGTSNKWGVQVTNNGIYYVDELNKNISAYTERVDSLTTTLGMDSYIQKNFTDTSIWNVDTYPGIRTVYDSINGEIFFTSKQKSLVFNEKIKQFTSLYTYDNMPFIETLYGDAYLISENGDIYRQHSIEETIINGTSRDISLTLIAHTNQESKEHDLTYDNVEFLADVWHGTSLVRESPFNLVEVWNNYQWGYNEIKWDTSIKGNLKSNLKKKFNIWRANIPRSKIRVQNEYKDYNKLYKLDRIRSPWVYVKLTNNLKSDRHFDMTDILINYTV